MNITYDYFRIFYYVAKYRSFTQAANVLMSNQPNVSRAIQNLENELGCRLFIRSNRGATLTPEGEKLFHRVSIAHHQLQAAEQELTDAGSLQNGFITIGVSETALHALLLPRLKQFHQLYPGIHIQLSSVTTPQAIANLRSGLVDLAVVTTPTGAVSPLKELPLTPMREILVAGPRFANLAEHGLTVKELKKYPMILLNSQTGTRHFYNKFLGEHGVSLLPDIEVATTDQILPMIRNDLGIGFLAHVYAREALEKQEVFEIPLNPEIPLRHICLVRDTQRPESIAVRALERLLQ